MSSMNQSTTKSDLVVPKYTPQQPYPQHQYVPFQQQHQQRPSQQQYAQQQYAQQQQLNQQHRYTQQQEQQRFIQQRLIQTGNQPTNMGTNQNTNQGVSQNTNQVENEQKTIETKQADQKPKIAQGVHLGDRGETFKKAVSKILEESKISAKYMQFLLSDKNIEKYHACFTSEFIDEDANYQVYEQLGDLTCNKFIGMYMYNKFPFLRCSEGVKIVARLKINYGAKQSFYEIGEQLGLWPFISAPIDLRNTKKKSLIEDVFEAFIGVTESILDQETKYIGIGFTVCYKILEKIFDTKTISLKYEDLYDAKTRLKELVDMYRNDPTRKLTIAYEEVYDETTQLTTSSVYRVINSNNKMRIGIGKAALLADAEQLASKEALKLLNHAGFIKPVPQIYEDIQSSQMILPLKINYTASDVDKLIIGTGKAIKHNTKYMCTALHLACKQRNLKIITELLELKADSTIQDSYGMTCFDSLLIGKYDDTVSQILDVFNKYEHVIQLHQPVYTVYYEKYKQPQYTVKVLQ